MPEKKEKNRLFPSSDVICLRRKNNTSRRSYSGLIREEGQACCLHRGREVPGLSLVKLRSSALLGSQHGAGLNPSLWDLETVFGQGFC